MCVCVCSGICPTIMMQMLYNSIYQHWYEESVVFCRHHQRHCSGSCFFVVSFIKSTLFLLLLRKRAHIKELTKTKFIKQNEIKILFLRSCLELWVSLIISIEIIKRWHTTQRRTAHIADSMDEDLRLVSR